MLSHAFWLKNAPFVFQESINNLLPEYEFVKVYLDDVLIHSKDQETHISGVEITLQKLNKNKISVNFSKSTLFSDKMGFLGQLVTKHGILPDFTPLDKIKNIEKPKNKKQIMQIVGVLQWFHPNVRNHGSKIKPITDLLGKESKPSWSCDLSNIVKEIIKEVESCSGLSYPDLCLPYTIHTDASDIGCGGVVQQRINIKGLFSKKFAATERGYSIVEREYLAIVLTLTKFESYYQEIKLKLKLIIRI